MKSVDKEIFKKFINSYPRNFEEEFITMVEPPIRWIYDRTLGDSSDEDAKIGFYTYEHDKPVSCDFQIVDIDERIKLFQTRIKKLQDDCDFLMSLKKEKENE